MSVAFRKIWRDLWNNKGRTLLVVLSIGVGVLALGMITASNTLMKRQMTIAQLASHPSNVILYLNGTVDEATIKGLTRLPEVVEADGLINTGIRWKATLEDEWQDATLIARTDYEHQTFDLLQLRSGQWPTGDNIAVEFNHIAPHNLPALGGTIYFEVNDRAKPFTLGGTLRDPGEFPPPFSQNPTFYVNRDLLETLGRGRDFDQIRFTIPEYSEAQAEAAAEVVEKRLNKIDVGVGFVQTQDPQRHFLQDTMDGVGLVLSVMAIMSLGLSTILVINTINAVIAQQVPQIGIMKTVGGLSHQIATLYLAGVTVYGLLSLALAVPLGALGAEALYRWLLAFINVPSASFEIVRASLLYQIGAGLLSPLLAALWPVLQGVAISVREAISAYGIGSGRYGAGLLDRLLGAVRGLPRLATLSLRNTFRRAGRVALTQITLLAAGAIFMMVLSTHYSFNQTIDQIFRGFNYDVIIGFEQTQRIDKVAPMLEAVPGVDFAEMWLFTTAQARHPNQSTEEQVFLRAVPRGTQLFIPELTAGRNLAPEDGHALLLNQKLARKMGLTVGDAIVLKLGDRDESTWTIVGLIFDLAGRDQNTAYIYREVIGPELGLVGRASVAEVRSTATTLAEHQQLEQDLRDYFKAQGIGLSFSDTALEEKEQANSQFSILTTLLLIMTFLIAVVGSMGLSGTLSINVLERRREIGVMRAVGASSMDVAFIFMGEGLLLGIISWLTAIPLSGLAGKWFVETLGTVVDFPAVYHYSVTSVWIWLAIVVTLSLLASWLPARRATQISVRESLAYE